MEISIESGKSEDLQVLIRFIGSKAKVSLKELAAGTPDLPSLKIGSEVISGTKTILLYLASFEPKLLGLTNLEKAEVDQWLSFSNAIKNTKNSRDFAKPLNDLLLHRVFFAAHFITVADLALYANLYSYVEKLTKKQRFEVCNISRWFDFLQHAAGVDLKKPLIQIDLDEEVTAKKAEEKPAKEKAVPAAAAAAATPAAQEPAAKGKAKGKESAPSGSAAAPAAKGDDDEGDSANVDVSRLNLKVGKILEVAKHAGADALYVEQIDVGEAKPRNVVSGLVKFMTMDDMKDRLIVVVANMKPAAMRGVTSEAMVLCASSPDGTKVEFVEPPAGSKPGDKVFVEGHDSGAPDAVLNPKKKVFEKLQPEFKTNNDLVACFKGLPFRTQSGVCTVKTIAGGSIK